MLAGLSSEAVIGAAVPEDSLKRRLNGIYRHLLQKIMLHVDAPLFLTVNNGGLSDYTRAMQKNDLFCASKMKNDIVVYDFFCLIALLDQDLSCGLNAPYIAVDIFEPIYQNDIPRVVDILMEDPDQIYQKSRYEQQTPIQAAANQNAWDCVIAIASTAKTDEEDAASYGAVLVYAAKNQLTKVAIALVQANASLYYSFDEIENSGLPKGRYFPIHFAIFYNDMSLLSALLQRDTCSNLTHYADTVSPLAFAISQKNAEASILILASDVELKLCADTIRQEIVQNKFDLINLFLKSDLIASSQKESITVILIEHALRALTLNPLFLTVINEIWKQNAIDFIMQHVQSNEIDKRDAVNTEERIAFHELLKLKILSAVMSGNPRFQTLPEEQKNSSGSGSGNSGFFPPINVRSSAFVVNNHPVKPADNRAETRRTFRRR